MLTVLIWNSTLIPSKEQECILNIEFNLKERNSSSLFTNLRSIGKEKKTTKKSKKSTVIAALLVIEERMEMMTVAPTNTHPILRKAHFLVPTVTSVEAAAIAPPSVAAAAGSAKSFKRTFLGWKTPKDNWRTGVN